VVSKTENMKVLTVIICFLILMHLNTNSGMIYLFVKLKIWLSNNFKISGLYYRL